ncbi:hypothetical protein Pcinc_032381 [Petrolisthes cinctipes]|uniref:Sulfotransferase domain-containing protein n=1 Tax=Petrolisthes cinctipes TaxID=88211 RepID=A0AAE1K1J8_PETCI|nr:hypothetical protein Pcinc_032381 [Petrolisthes cinctipes]
MSKKRLLSGHEYEPMSEEFRARMRKDQEAFSDTVLRILPEGWLYPGAAPKFLDKIQSFDFRSDDVVVMTFPKAGTTWMQEILWTMMHNPDLDNPLGGTLHMASFNGYQVSVYVVLTIISFDMNCDGKTLNEMQMEAFAEAFEMMCPDKKEEDGVSLQMLEAIPGEEGVKYSTFSSMKSRGEPTDDLAIFNEGSCFTFFRKGVTVDWRTTSPLNWNEDMDKWIKENLAGTDITFRMTE